MERDAKDTCEFCPAWCKHVDYDGKEVLVPMRNGDGTPMTKDGQPQFERTSDGRFVMSGACRLHAPQIVSNQTMYPTPKSNWWCEDPERHRLLDRQDALALVRGRPDRIRRATES